MVEIVHNPWKKIVLHEVIFYKLEDLLSIHSIGLSPGQLGKPLLWGDGIIFRHTGAPPIDIIVKENLNGTIHMMSIEFAVLDEYKPVMEFPEYKIRVPVVNISSNESLMAVVDYLKERISLGSLFKGAT